MKKNLLWLPLVALGLLSMAWGLARGEMGLYFSKAINICLECVGIG